ncbi:MAG: serine hydrolase, partial [Planctomycetes bacterium]|nr:serine hydrolase [Planctomycetota bacterium]
MRQISLVVLLAAAVVAPGCRLPSARRLDRIDEIVAEEMAARHFPGAVVLVGRRDRVLYCKAFGAAMIEPAHEPMHRDTIFDLAS